MIRLSLPLGFASQTNNQGWHECTTSARIPSHLLSANSSNATTQVKYESILAQNYVTIT